ncbi:hypothetical protein J1G43_15095 [Cellulomonas sp. zg-ZUI22]|uniref:hypothetical protein n=1 Tax=Cellulomonas sp. zg-ZUI22 TaxID=2816955 RepID=UPI001A953F15|nr:hypothetical protein [Cellulomonas sp. zg-ZUI22]MBO0901290.1 hypothetical protein [Cellulomonas sp. zg-ZUI22]
MHASTYDYSTYDTGPGAGEVVGIVLVGALYVAFLLFGIYLYMRVARKAGWTIWHGLLMLVPVANVVFLIMFAFTEWPVERRLREAEARLALATGEMPGGGAAGYPGAAPYGYGTGYGAPAPAYGGTAPGYGDTTPAAPGYGAPASPYDSSPAGPVPPAPGASPWDPPAAPPAPGER